MRFRLLSRQGCHLCEDVAGFLAHLDLEFEIVNVDEDAELQRQYGFEVPVLFLGDNEIIRAPVTPSSLRAALAAAGVTIEMGR